MENKTDLRAKIKNLRKTLDINTVSDIITAKIRKHPAFLDAKNVMLYYPLKYEINLLPLLSEKKDFYFPRVEGEKLLVCPACNNFKLSKLKINEPCSTPVCPDVLDLIVVPALAVDKQGYRLGYGGGFYDRFLAENKNITTITPVLKEFVFDKLPTEGFDVPISYILTD